MANNVKGYDGIYGVLEYITSLEYLENGKIIVVGFNELYAVLNEFSALDGHHTSERYKPIARSTYVQLKLFLRDNPHDAPDSITKAIQIKIRNYRAWA